MKTKHYILAVILSLSMSTAIASEEGVIVRSSGTDAGMVLDYKHLMPVFPMLASFDEQILPLIPEQMSFLPVVPMTAPFEDVPVFEDMVSQSSSLRPVVPMEAGFCSHPF